MTNWRSCIEVLSISIPRYFVVSLVLFFFLLTVFFNPPLVLAQSSNAGWIGEPKPTQFGSDFQPGCLITFKSPNWKGDVPDFPCAVSCTGPRAKEIENLKHFANWCKWYGPNKDTTAYLDENGDQIVPINAPETPGYTKCVVNTGPKGYPNWTHWFPNGHPRCGRVTGEPHLRTFDDLKYDLQAVGEFIAGRSLDDNMQVQVRMEPFSTGIDFVTVATAVAAQVGQQRIMIASRTGTPLLINGEPFEIAEGEALRHEDDGTVIFRRQKGYSLVWPDGTNLHVELMGRHIDIHMPVAKPRDGRLEGIMGNADGDNGENDFRTRDGKALPAPPEFDTLYNEFAESWRVTPGESLFHYDEGQSTETFTNRGLPTREVTIDDLDAVVRTAAEKRCRDGGVVEPEALEQCIFDVGFTGDDVFITSALNAQTPPELREVLASDEETGALKIDAPAAGFAAHSLEVRISGPAQAGYWLGFAPVGSDNKGQALLSNSSKSLKGGDQVVALGIPPTPGDYELRYSELRYKESGDDHGTLHRQMFQSVAPELEIVAPATATAGGKLEISVIGNIGEHTTLTIVSAGSDDTALGEHFYLNQGTEQTGIIRRLPDEPGDYEIRCRSNSNRGVQIYARRRLTIQ